MIAVNVTVNYIMGRGENEALLGGCKLNKKKKMRGEGQVQGEKGEEGK